MITRSRLRKWMISQANGKKDLMLPAKTKKLARNATG
jgi:hypothetical protein